jgi:hypothetical protein
MDGTYAGADRSIQTYTVQRMRLRLNGLNGASGDPLLEKLSLKLHEGFAEDADGLAAAHRVAQAAVQALRQAGAAAESISQAAIDAVTPELREAEQAVTAAEDHL